MISFENEPNLSSSCSYVNSSICFNKIIGVTIIAMNCAKITIANIEYLIIRVPNDLSSSSMK